MEFVPSASAFSLPLRPWQQSRSLRVTLYEPNAIKEPEESNESNDSRESKKRKNEDDTDDQTGADDGETTDAVSDVGQSVILSPDEAHQYRVAGLSFNEELPDTKYFPHAPVKEKDPEDEGKTFKGKGKGRKAKKKDREAKDADGGVNHRRSVPKQLSKLSPPIYVPQSAAQQGNLRLRHLAVLTSVLHRCLLEGDYIRAGRAWGLIIREQFGGTPIDVRTDDRWGIGAEILLRKDRQISDEHLGIKRTDYGSYVEKPRLLFTREGFKAAKLYYEILITQHPFQKDRPELISALHFYPAMFGLWIYVAQEESADARRERKAGCGSGSGPEPDEPEPGSENDGQSDGVDDQSLAAESRKIELSEAEKIAESMDAIITSPPYSDSPELLELRGMVCEWIADLVISSLPGTNDAYEPDENHASDDSDGDVLMSTVQPDGLEERQEWRRAIERRQREVQRSKEFKNKAAERKQSICSKNRQHQPRAIDPPNQLRQAIAEQARVEVPPTTLVAPVPIPGNRQAPIDRYGTPFRDPAAERPVLRDAFDTDVEGIDESTIAATSVIGMDEVQYRFPPPAQVPANATANGHMNLQYEPQHHSPQLQPQQQPSPSPTRQLRTGRRANESKWYEGLGDRALKSAGFDLGDLDAASQNTSTAGDDEQSNDTDDQRFVPRYRAAEEPLSRRLQNFWTASRRTTFQPDNVEHTEPTKTQSFIPITSTTKPLPANSRKVTLTRSMTTTPRTRFSPPKPSLLDQLDLTPTRRSPGITRTHSRKDREREREREKETSRTADDTIRGIDRVTDQGLGLFTNNNTNHTRAGAGAGGDDSFQSLNAFDMTNFDDLENDSSMNDPFSRRASIRWVGPPEADTPPTHTPTHVSTLPNLKPSLKRRHLELDYPPEILNTKSFADLQAEPFDRTPNPKAAAEVQPQRPPEKGKDEDKMSFLIRLSKQERGEYFSKLSMDEWEECGDLLIEEFSKLMTKMKDLRHARRKTASVFEAEIKRRNDVVEEQSAEISSKFQEMRAGGAEVLRGRSP
ncbi:extracellular mutant protein 11-domain-containing protein [Aspergillus multicolor]|uniref:extracellular mutant protein 11-domain-containing protein n=1 Tax=Aspergillus multicolor TaxID=41759 RepID=UPI003CCE33CA